MKRRLICRMSLPVYIADAFVDGPFSGNPAAVCMLEYWLPDHILQAIAAQHNLSETAFIVHEREQYTTRWFTPTAEVDLCGHATLASAHILHTEYNVLQSPIPFFSPRSGALPVSLVGNEYQLDFPADHLEPMEVTDVIQACFSSPICSAWLGRSDYLLVLENEASVQHAHPNMSCLAELPARGIIITAAGESVDFVSRFFGPQVGVPEDPVTGSAHTTLAVYWHQHTGKTTFEARQLSQRGGTLSIQLHGDRVWLSGRAHTYLRGEIEWATT